MPITHELPHTPLEGVGFFQDTVNVNNVEPQGQSMAAAQQVEALDERRRKKRPDTKSRDVSLDSLQPEEKRVKFNNVEGEGQCNAETQRLEATHDDITPGLQDAVELNNDSSVVAPPAGEDVETCIKRITAETQLLFGKLKETLCESEEFESFCPSRVDEYLKEAYALEESLKVKKEAMRKRLSAIASTLECFGNS